MKAEDLRQGHYTECERISKQAKFINILLHADVCRCFLEDLLHGRSQVVHLTLVFFQRHLQVLKQRKKMISLHNKVQKGKVMKKEKRHGYVFFVSI